MSASSKSIQKIDLENIPRWFHPAGAGLSVRWKSKKKKRIILTSKLGATTTISFKSSEKKWRIDYRLGNGHHTNTKNSVFLTTAQLLRAFNVKIGHYSKRPYAIKGLCYRKDNFLNLPQKGTGLDGDPNLSIYLKDEIKQELIDLVESVNAVH